MHKKIRRYAPAAVALGRSVMVYCLQVRGATKCDRVRKKVAIVSMAGNLLGAKCPLFEAASMPDRTGLGQSSNRPVCRIRGDRQTPAEIAADAAHAASRLPKKQEKGLHKEHRGLWARPVGRTGQLATPAFRLPTRIDDNEPPAGRTDRKTPPTRIPLRFIAAIANQNVASPSCAASPAPTRPRPACRSSSLTYACSLHKTVLEPRSLL